MSAKVSIIIPVYNVEKYIEKCLTSIEKQSYCDFEAIIIDDGSTDNSLVICEKFTAKNTNFKLFHQKNVGLSAARNYGIAKSSGDFLIFIDGDDEVLPDFIGLLIDKVETEKADIVECGYNEIYPKISKIVLPKKSIQQTGENATINLLIFQDNIDIVVWNKIYRRTLFTNISFPINKVCEDNLTTYKLLVKAKKVCYLDKALYNYYRRKNSITQKTKPLIFCQMREKAAMEAMYLFRNNKKLLEASKYSILLAYLKYIDFSLTGRIGEEYFNIYQQKILTEKKSFLKLKYLDKKRKIYIKLLTLLNGIPYKLFRKIKNDKSESLIK